jgi:hypothetical protein
MDVWQDPFVTLRLPLPAVEGRAPLPDGAGATIRRRILGDL